MIFKLLFSFIINPVLHPWCHDAKRMNSGQIKDYLYVLVMLRPNSKLLFYIKSFKNNPGDTAKRGLVI